MVENDGFGAVAPADGLIDAAQRPLITVITPCLNASDTISENLLSVLAARKALVTRGWELEHLVVEGGSVDGTAELVTDHATRHSYCRITANIKGGPYAAMNAGLGQATGHYTHILNSDDLLLDPDAYASFVVEGHRKGAKVLISSIGYFRRPSHQVRSLWVVESIPINKPQWQRELLRGLHYPHPGFIAETKMYREEGFDESYSLSADYKLMQNILIGPAMPETTLTSHHPLVSMAEGGATGNWKAILKGRQQLAAINKDLGIKAPSLKRYWRKIRQRMRPLPKPMNISSLVTPDSRQGWN